MTRLLKKTITGAFVVYQQSTDMQSAT